MADDPRSVPRDPELARRLSVEPLDELTRRRLVTTALGESPPVARPRARTWRVAVAVAAVLLVAVGAIALLTAQGGHDEPTALQERNKTPAGSSSAPVAPVTVGDFGDLDRPANLDALRTRLAADASEKASSTPLADATAGEGAASGAVSPSPCRLGLPVGASVLGTGTGTIDGRHATVSLVARADGTRTYEALLEGPCETRHLP